ncbi:ATP-binding cassette domain-containing protein [Micromonospora costi]|uniref:ABC transporter ATP-binding protein n=1 Tax=Micromonospora costi TaxID=1530042 RepID=UPI003410D3BD
MSVETAPRVVDRPRAAGAGDVEVRAVTKRYGDTVALDAVSFTVPAGTITGFVGNNGSGKTTAIRIITGLLQQDAGAVRVADRPVTAGFRSAIGYMPEERGLYPEMRVARQLEYLARLYGAGKARAREQVAGWLERLGAARYASAKLNTLSLGNQQRVQLIAALLNGPRLVILDEPFSGLDRAAVAAMSEILRELAADGVGVFFSSHQLDIVESICERAVILHAGRVVAEGTVTQLLDRGDTVVRVTFEASVPADRMRAALPRARVLHGDTWAVPVDTDDPSRVLRECLRLGEVTEFSRARQSLSDIFAEVWRADAPE